MAQYELNLRDYIRIVRKRKLIIIVIFLVVTIVTTFFSMQQVSTYQAETTIKIEERKTIAGLLTEWIAYNPGDTMESQAKLIRSHKVMKSAALRMRIININSTDDEINKAVNVIDGKIRTELVGNTNIIRIIATSLDSQEAVELANTVADIYIEENLLDKTRQARNARKFIEEQLTSLEMRLQQKEEKIKEQRDKVKNIAFSESMQEKLGELQFKLTGLLQKYTEKHPNIIEIQNQIEDLERKNTSLAGKELEYARLLREVEADKKLYSLLKERLEETRITEAQKVGDISVVNPAVTANKKLAPNQNFGFLVGAILGLVLGFAAALIMESLDTSIGTIEDVENLLQVPVLGVIPSVSLKGEAKLKGKLLDILKQNFVRQPRSEVEERYVRLITHYDPMSPIAESYRNIHTNLKLNDSKRKTFLITSAGPREGKSSILVNLGIALAQSGLQILLVSSDIRRPVIARTFGIKRESGLTDVALGVVGMDDAIKNITDIMLGDMTLDEIQLSPGLDNLSILTSGQLPFNPAKVLESKEFTAIIEDLKKRFDVVLFDSPPVLPVTDASLIASKVDAVIMVYEIGRTSREALLRAKNQIDSVGATIQGIVLNQTRKEAEADVISPYYYKYRYYKAEADSSHTGKKTAKV